MSPGPQPHLWFHELFFHKPWLLHAPTAAGRGLQQAHARNANQKSLRKDRLTVPAA